MYQYRTPSWHCPTVFSFWSSAQQKHLAKFKEEAIFYQAMAVSDRKHPRYETRLQVRFEEASDFVCQYAENLSAGGLFVVGAHKLKPLEELKVALQLPGFREISLKAQVAHVMDEETAKRYGRSAGAGLQILESPPDFSENLVRYLGILGRRRDHVLYCENPLFANLLEKAGFRTSLAILEGLPDALAKEAPLALVVDRRSAREYREQVQKSESSVLVIGCDYPQDSEVLLAELDRRT